MSSASWRQRTILLRLYAKVSKYKLVTTPAQERELECVLLLCRRLYNVALEQRITAWQRCRVSVSQSQQQAELKDIRAAFPAYAAIHSHVLQEVLARLDRTYQAFFTSRAGEREGRLPTLQVCLPLHQLHLQGV
ncbi:MAG TPA: helix-turn-helix domain-containing protein [Ktedonobacterales bacterium]|nr:helix-turn-helix domain-containing protein [Ktedonobacterales bacterium]